MEYEKIIGCGRDQSQSLVSRARACFFLCVWHLRRNKRHKSYYLSALCSVCLVFMDL